MKFNVQLLTKLCEYLLDGEPVFIIRAQDAAAPAAVAGYIQDSHASGGANLIRCQRHLDRIVAWQKENPNRVKAAD